jgi:hypothetical protein
LLETVEDNAPLTVQRDQQTAAMMNKTTPWLGASINLGALLAALLSIAPGKYGYLHC